MSGEPEEQMAVRWACGHMTLTHPADRPWSLRCGCGREGAAYVVLFARW